MNAAQVHPGGAVIPCVRTLGVAACLLVLATATGSAQALDGGGAAGAYTPPACVGVFSDVPCTAQFAAWIEQFYRDGVTSGCGATTYCPENPVTRRQMAVFVERAMRGTSGWPPHTVLVHAVRASDGSPDPAASGEALVAGLASIPTTGTDVPSASNPWLVRVGPGIYELGSSGLTVPAWVSVEGAGVGVTVVTAAGRSGSGTGTIYTGGNQELRFLTVRAGDTGAYARAVYNSGPNLSVVHARLVAEYPAATAGTGDARAYLGTTGSSVTMTDVVAEGRNGCPTYGIYQGDGYATLTRVEAISVGSYNGTACHSYAVYATGSVLRLADSRVYAESYLQTFGVIVSSAEAAELRSSVISTNGLTTAWSPAVRPYDVNVTISGCDISGNTGISAEGSVAGYTVEVASSRVKGSPYYLTVDADYTGRIGGSRLEGSTSGSGIKVCAGNWDETTAFFASTCP